MKRVGLDIGSTTIKTVVVDENDNILFENYDRHYAHIKEKLKEKLKYLLDNNIVEDNVLMAVSGSAAMGISDEYNIAFVQEVYASRLCAKKLIPDVDVIIELGGEDAKILFLDDQLEVRMNGTCAGGTGAFIDQMASLLNVDTSTINELAKKYEKIYPIASRCGVFAKTDVQPLINQGAKKEDISYSIFKAVVNQTIGGLAQGRDIKGMVGYLGGPLTFLSELRKAFDEELKVTGILPKHSLYYVALGTAFAADKEVSINNILSKNEQKKLRTINYKSIKPLFESENELEEFRKRHQKASVKTLPLEGYTKDLYLGIDSGSTTLKFILIDEDENIRYERYLSNKGNPVDVIKSLFIELYEKYPNVKIKASASTGYGEDLCINAFNLDGGLVETMAHFYAARKFMPEVDFIIDIGGQDIKCFKIENGIITNIFLNEACSSGCGSFLQTFANALGYDIKEFAKIGLLAKSPVELGSRCTVFMNSSVKQAQKDGASIDNISAGLSISVVKNAIYKVIRATSKDELGHKIVVQGGTFYNEAVLRAFERELDLEVVCPNISGVMGAYGAALYAKSLNIKNTTTLKLDELKNLVHNTKLVNCGLCPNNCQLTVNIFSNNNKFISGNRCDKPLKSKSSSPENMNLHNIIKEKLLSYKPSTNNKRGDIILPLVLNMYELLPFWHTFFENLGFNVHNTGFSDNKTYIQGQQTIPSDTVCYPAKLVHGHIENVLKTDIKYVFYPCMSYNINESKSDNHFNCPIVAYYPETIKNNVTRIKEKIFIAEYIGIHNQKLFIQKITPILNKYFTDIKSSEIKKASQSAYKEYENYLTYIKDEGKRIIKEARLNNQRIIVLAGRPYHIDPEVNHGIDKLIASFGCAIVTEESVAHYTNKTKYNVLNQWTYHARLYDAARYVTQHKDMELVQLVSFGCGLDAITTDEVKHILDTNGKIYTQIKIDEITNLGAIKIRLRSLFKTLEEKEKE